VPRQATKPSGRTSRGPLGNCPALGPNSLRNMDYALAAAEQLTPDAAEAANIIGLIGDVVASGAYPHFARRIIEARDLTFAEQFEYGLDRVLDGIGGSVSEQRHEG
jgi:hypothetical protein